MGITSAWSYILDSTQLTYLPIKEGSLLALLTEAMISCLRFIIEYNRFKRFWPLGNRSIFIWGILKDDIFGFCWNNFTICIKILDIKVFKRGHRSVLSLMFHLFILFVTLRFPNHYAFHHVLGIVGKHSINRGVPSNWFCMFSRLCKNYWIYKKWCLFIYLCHSYLPTNVRSCQLHLFKANGHCDKCFVEK